MLSSRLHDKCHGNFITMSKDVSNSQRAQNVGHKTVCPQIRKRDEQDHWGNFPNSVVATIACGHCSRPEGFQDQIVRECSALIKKVE